MIYQIYPRSFADANGDGIGDLAGIIERLDHVRGTDTSLGVDAIWLSPIYPSPLADFGYDVSDYVDVAAEFGTLHDFDRLVEACHARGLRLIMDLVPCHTSVEHPWFVESRSSRSSAKRDWYMWADPGPDGGPPNNWTCAFGGSAWELDSSTGQYYHHSFYAEQPDLNWRNAEVTRAMHGVLEFWFERGVDGFRVDAVAHAIKDELLRDNPPLVRRRPSVSVFGARDKQEPLWNLDRPEVHDVVRGLREVADRHGERVLIGEVYAPLERLASYFGRDDEFQLAWNFELLHTPWNATEFAVAIERAEALHPPGVWPSIAFSNHDNQRHGTRWGRERTRVAALMLLTLRGVPTIYMGEEIGMVDHRSLPTSVRFDRAGRDAQRTPMQWEPMPSAGFTSGTPWLPAFDPEVVSVAAQRDDPASLLSLYRRLIALRRELPALATGTQRSIFGAAPNVLAWTREGVGVRLLVVANLADEPRTANVDRVGRAGRVVVGTGARDGEGPYDLARLELGPREGLVLDVR